MSTTIDGGFSVAAETDVVLDTPPVVARSHIFYGRNGFRNGFRLGASADLPAGSRCPDRDSILCRLRLVAPL